MFHRLQSQDLLEGRGSFEETLTYKFPFSWQDLQQFGGCDQQGLIEKCPCRNPPGHSHRENLQVRISRPDQEPCRVWPRRTPDILNTDFSPKHQAALIMAERYFSQVVQYIQPKDVIHLVLANLGHRRREAHSIDHKVKPEAALSRPFLRACLLEDQEYLQCPES